MWPHPFSFIKSSASAFDPATLNLSGWWRIPYGGAPLAAVASAGSSGSNGNLVTNGNDPSVGANLNGHALVDFDGTNDNLRNTNDITTFATTTASTVIAVFKVDAVDAATGNVYDDANLLNDGNADYGITLSAGGGASDVNITGFGYDGAYRSKTVVGALNTYHAVMMRHNGTDLGMTLDGASEVTQACGTLAVLTGIINIGRGYAGGHFFNGQLVELITSQVALTPTNFTDYRTSYLASRYGI